MGFKSVARQLVPKALRDWRWSRVRARQQALLDNLPLNERFDHIYKDGLWGRDESGAMSSGNGSRDEIIVGPYIAAMTALLKSLGGDLRLVDIGAGDFGVGSRLAPFVDHYTACDISSVIVDQNRRRFQTLSNVDFVVLDATRDTLPSGDIVTIRQVFQHLSNKQITDVLSKLKPFQYIVITEGIPELPFTPNIDHASGASIRLIENGSGVDVALPPFNLDFSSSRVLCEPSNTVSSVRCTIRTTLYVR